MATQIRGNQIKEATVEALRLVGTDIATLGTVTTGTWSASTIDVAHGGTGATTASDARTNLGLAIGTDVQAYNSTLAAVAGGTYTGDDSITTVGTISSGTWQGSQIGASYLPKLNSITAPDGSVSLNDQKLTNVADPSSDKDAANKRYVDTLSAGLRSFKEPARVASSSNVNISSPGATVDGVTLNSGDRVLLYGQTSGSQNGIYVFNGAASAMTRASDADTSAEMQPNHYIWVSEGTHADEAYVCTNDSITLDTTVLTYVQFSGLGNVTAGNGLSKTGNTLDVNVGNGVQISSDAVALKLDGSTLSVSGDGVKISASGVSATELATSVAGNGLSGGGGSALAVNTSGALGVSSDNVVLLYNGNEVGALSTTFFFLTDVAGTQTLVIKDSAIITSKLAASAVTTAKIADANVTEAKLNTSVAGAGLSGGGGSALAVNVGGVMAVNADTVVLQHSAANVNSFNSTHFTNNAGEFKIAADAISATEIASGAVGSDEIASQAVTAAKIASSAISSGGGLAGGNGTALSVQFSRETPSGSVNGSNTAFTLAHTPTSGSLLLFRNGLLQDSGADYTLSGSSVTMTTAPDTGDILRAWYLY